MKIFLRPYLTLLHIVEGSDRISLYSLCCKNNTFALDVVTWLQHLSRRCSFHTLDLVHCLAPSPPRVEQSIVVRVYADSLYLLLYYQTRAVF